MRMKPIRLLKCDSCGSDKGINSSDFGKTWSCSNCKLKKIMRKYNEHRN